MGNVAGEGMRGGREGDTILGVAFNADQLGLEQAESRAWQMLMERLDPQELRGTALYHGPVMLPNGQRALILAVSGPRTAVTYVRDAFTAPDLVAFTGMLPAAQRIIRAGDLPRERLSLVGYINERGAILLADGQQELLAVAQHARWPIANPSRPIPARFAPVLQNQPQGQPEREREHEATQALRATKLEGATQMNLRIFRPSYREHAPFRRRVLFAAIGTLLILASIGIVASRALANHSLAHGISRAATPLPPTPTPTVAPQPILVVAPLALKVPCTVGKAVQFTISNTGSANLDWSSNAALYAPRLQVSNLNGTIAAGASLTVQVALGQAVKASQQLALVIQSNGGTVQITVTLSPC